jgi:AcrR family transcriptional regulator
MNAVARRAGISPGSLYQYFPGKDALVEEASRRIVARLQRATRKVSCAGTRSARPTAETAVDRLLEAAVSLAREHPALPALLAPTEQAGPNILLRTIARSLPSSGVVHNDGVTRDLATRIFCTGLGLAVQQPDPAVLLRATCRAVLSTLGATDDPQPSALPPAASQAGSSITAEG